MHTQNEILQAKQIDQVVRDYFISNPDVVEIFAKDLMPLFIETGIFQKDDRSGLPIRNILRKLDSENKLDLLKHCHVVRKAVNRNWYFRRTI